MIILKTIQIIFFLIFHFDYLDEIQPKNIRILYYSIKHL